MATVTTEVGTSTLVALIKRMFPHESFPDGPYERCAAVVEQTASEDPRSRALLSEGLRETAASGFTDLSPQDAHAYLERISASAFFALVQGAVVTSLYNDPEVWAILGWETDSFSQGGYLERGFDDLDWLPAARVEGPAS